MIYRLFDSHVAELMQQAISHAEHVSLGAAASPGRLGAGDVVTGPA